MISLIRRKSKIQGFGIFANKNIKKGEKFYKIPIDSVSSKPIKRLAFIRGIGWVNDTKVLNWVNHSCVPNTKFNVSESKSSLVARRDISLGEEITCDYNKTEKGGEKVSCNCGSKKCKGHFLRII